MSLLVRNYSKIVLLYYSYKFSFLLIKYDSWYLRISSFNWIDLKLVVFIGCIYFIFNVKKINFVFCNKVYISKKKLFIFSLFYLSVEKILLIIFVKRI